MADTMYDVENGLPAFLDPVFDWLATKLPPQIVDSVLVPGLTHVYTLGHSLYDVAVYLTSSHPSTWDATKILPPLITLLGAYLAILSFYRTTGWMIRTSLWFAKWGTIFSALVGGAGYLMGTRGGDGNVMDNLMGILNMGGGASGVAKAAAGMLWDAINSPGNEQPRRRPRTRSQTPSSSSSGRRGRSDAKGRAEPEPKTRAGKAKAKADKPKAWESFDSHQQYRAGAGADDDDAGAGNLDAQKIMEQITGFADKMGWLGAARDFLGGSSREDVDEDDEADGASAKGSTKGKKASRVW